jgi:hypothetical protein
MENMKLENMKSLCNRAKAPFTFALTILMLSTVTFAESDHENYYGDDGATVRWNSIKGVITAPGIDNPVAGISAGTLPWTTTRGKARVNLATGAAYFEVEGLVLNGGNATGTTGPIDQVEGSLVCNAGTDNQVISTTDPVPLSSTGDAEFSGNIGAIPSPCANPLFLIRIGPDRPGANQRWIATGAVRVGGN